MEPRTLTVAEIQRVLEAHKSNLANLGVQSLAVFGSVARGEATGGSDIDFLVEFAGSATLARYMELKLLLEALFGCPIDLVTRKSLRSRVQAFVEKDAVRVA